MALGSISASKRNEYQEYFVGVKTAVAKGPQPYHHPVPLSRNLGLSRPVMGLIYLYLYLNSVGLWVWLGNTVYRYRRHFDTTIDSTSSLLSLLLPP